jgi:hypothetical protein
LQYSFSFSKLTHLKKIKGTRSSDSNTHKSLSQWQNVYLYNLGNNKITGFLLWKAIKAWLCLFNLCKVLIEDRKNTYGKGFSDQLH